MRPLTHLGDLLGTLPAGEGITLHSGAAHPTVLAGQLAEAAGALGGRRVHALMPCGPVPYADAPARDHLDIATFLPGAGLRAAMDAGRVQAWRKPLSTAPGLFARGACPAGAVLLRIAPPDEAGRASLGVAVDYMPAAIRAARLVVAEIDPAMPRVAGPGWLDAGRIDACVEAAGGPHEMPPAQADAVDDAIAGHVVSLLGDGAVLQLGVGSLADRILSRLGHLRHLGLHTGIIGGGAQALIEQGVIDNSTKEVLPGVSVATMALGSAAFYAFLDRNPAIELHPCSLTHGGPTLRRLSRLHAINSALQVDLHGRVNAEWAGARRVSLPGGLADFARAAASLPNGRSIVALRACGRGGASAIVPELATQPCSLAQQEVDCYVTEYGVASVRGASPEERRKALVAIAHPEHRDALASA